MSTIETYRRVYGSKTAKVSGMASKIDRARGHLLPSLFVWTIWVLMLGASLAFIWKYGSNVPSWDGWDMVPTLTGEQPITVSWLWSQHNEHRVPLPRLML